MLVRGDRRFVRLPVRAPRSCPTPHLSWIPIWTAIRALTPPRTT